MPNLSHLNSMHALEAAVRKGSLAAAATELGISPAAVGQRIRTLEDYLGVALLTRGRHAFAPAPALEPAIEDLRLAFAHLDSAAQTL